MKIVKKIGIFLLVLIVLCFSYLLIEYDRFVNKKPPLIIIEKSVLKDGGTTIYTSILFSETVYKDFSARPINGKIKNRTFKTILFSKTIYDKVPYTIRPVNSSEFDIVDETETCLDSLEKFYVDDMYAYSFSCMKSDNVFLKFHEGTKISVKEALNKNIVTINTLEEKGLEIFKEPIKDVINEISYNSLIKSINNKESFVLLIQRDNCSYCKLYEPKFNRVLFMNDLTAKSINTNSLSDSQTKNLLNMFKIEGTPTTIFISNGKEINIDNRIVGNQSEEIIINSLKEEGYLK